MRMLSVALFMFVACTSSPEEPSQDELEKEILGEWNNIYLRVEINSKNGTDSSEVLEVDHSQWEEKLKIRPIRSFFRSDSSWHSAHYNLNDTLIYDPSGRWWLDGDKLTLQQSSPSPDTTVYTLKISNDTATFEAMLDWDMDGRKDDKYIGRQIKIK
jgi:hypothetical protein